MHIRILFQIYYFQLLTPILGVVFSEQKFSILMKFNFYIFSFVTFVFGVMCKKSLPNQAPWFTPMFSFNNFLVLAPAFRFLIHSSWGFFCIRCEIGVELHSFACGYLTISASFTKKNYFIHVALSWHPGQKSLNRRYLGLFMDS